MALGERQQNKFKDASVFGSYSFTNSQGEIDKSAMSIRYWNGFLVVAILPFKGLDANGIAQFDRDNEHAIYLKHAKAAILLKEIEEFQKNPDSYTNYGVNSGSGLISISNGKEYSENGVACIIIRKVDNDGVTQSSIAYEFKKEYYFAVRNYNETAHTSEAVFEPYADTEIELFKNILRTYVMAGTSAYAAENINKQQYQNNRLADNVEAICSKLGVEYSARNKATKSNNSGFFSNNKSQGTPKEFQNSTLDDINNLMN